MARRSAPEIVAGLVIVAGAVGGGFVGIASGHGGSGGLATIVRCLAGVAIGGALTVAAVGLVLILVEGVKTIDGNPSNEPTLSESAALEEATPESLGDARMYAVATVGCLLIGAIIFVTGTFFLVGIAWFLALVFALLARRASGDDRQWRRASTLLWVASIVVLVVLFVRESGLVAHLK